MRSDIESVIAESDVLVVGLSDANIFEALEQHVREDQIVLDLVNIPQREALRGKVMGLVLVTHAEADAGSGANGY